ncbi:MAG: hypothetical protein IPH82_29670 [Chloroflexi bacterium]|nr:hypothetical protein [Chloroflexota bacterium]
MGGRASLFGRWYVHGRERPLWLRLMPAVGLVVFDSWRGGKGEERPFQFVSLPAVGGRCRLVGESRGNGRFGFSHCQPLADDGMVEKVCGGRNGRLPCAVISCPISRSQVQLTPMMQGSTDDWRRE